jgi:hypothetical protein
VRFRIYMFFIFLLAPFVGLGIACAQLQTFSSELQACVLEGGVLQGEAGVVEAAVQLQLHALQESIGETLQAAEMSGQLAGLLRREAHAELLAYEQQHSHMQGLVETSAQQKTASADMLEYLLANMLGDPIGQTFGKNAVIKVYSLEEAGYRGYMAKVRLHNTGALRMVLAGDRVGSSGETTSAAAKRTGAILAVNAGGFFAHEGGLLPIGITVIDGEVLTFSTYDKDLSFVGFNRNGQLVGGRIDTEEQLVALDVLHGASFLPTLLKGGKKQPIPAAWANTRHPRTLIGHFKNDDLLFIVIDGRREGWSMGVTLEEAQSKLLEFNVRDAYNLDGGGSSAFYYDGKVLNRPSDGKERRVTTNIVVFP